MDLRLKDLRNERHLTQQQVADKIGVQCFTYGAWERGDRTLPFSRACDIADALECTLDALIGREVPPAMFTGDANSLVSLFNKCSPERRSRLLEIASDYAQISEMEVFMPKTLRELRDI